MNRMINVSGTPEIGYCYELPTNEAEAWELIKQERSLRTLYGGYLVQGNWYHSDLISRIQQTGLMLLGARIPPSLKWKTMSGSKTIMTPELAQAVFIGAAQQDSANFDAAEVVLETVKAIGNYSTFDYFSASWPPAYWER